MSADETSALNNKTKERTFILECIEVYKALPALWNVKSEEYSNRQKKNASYEILVTKYRKRFPDATREDVTKKFNSLRTNYRKELKRINDTKRSDNGTDETEAPTLWYFNEMNFLADQGVIRNSINTIEEENNSTNNVITQVDNENVNTIKQETVEQIKQPVKKRKKNVHDELMSLACDRLKTSESEYDKIAKTWAVELQKLSTEQQVHAKKAINDILYEGQLGNLYRNCVQINDPPISRIFTPTNSSTSIMSSLGTYQEFDKDLEEPYIPPRSMSV